MNAQINAVALVLFAIDFVFAFENKIAEYDSITAEYCINFDTEYELKKKDKTAKCDFITTECCLDSSTNKKWELLLYKQFVPLIFKIQTKSHKYNSDMSAYLDADIKFYTFSIMGSDRNCIGVSSNGKNFRCEINMDKEYMDKEYNIYDYFHTLYFYSQKIDSVQISVLFDKVFPIKWNLKFEIDKQPHNLSGSYNIKISGICNEEQLKKIETLNKARKENTKEL